MCKVLVKRFLTITHLLVVVKQKKIKRRKLIITFNCIKCTDNDITFNVWVIRTLRCIRHDYQMDHGKVDRQNHEEVTVVMWLVKTVNVQHQTILLSNW